MPRGAFASWMLSQEARALRARLDRVRPILLQETMVPAAVPAAGAIAAIEDFLAAGRRSLRQRIDGFLGWLDGAEGRTATPAEANRSLTFLRLRFNAVLTQLDVFSEAMSQRSEADTGVLLRGLELAAHDAMQIPGVPTPPVLCYLARDAGGAIRRARTRLPGGGLNPVALIRLPRERMLGSGVASSLVHEAGHQAADNLGLVAELRRSLASPWPTARVPEVVQQLWWRWASEIMADLWAIARVGIASTLGLVTLVSLPRAFVMRVDAVDPHPSPWIRVLLSCAIGDELYAHPQWRRLAALWRSYYPLESAPRSDLELLDTVQRSIPYAVQRILACRSDALGGRSLREALQRAELHPDRLARSFDRWRLQQPATWRAAPCVAFAALGQARMDGVITPEAESRAVGQLLREWALRSSLASARVCSASSSQPHLVSGAGYLRAGILVRSMS
ncbi:MAG: hypothetical protein IPN34_16315 [Planctomycetes bacterium]|nr:hypothetical protein [Planctomycetota bacterium]